MQTYNAKTSEVAAMMWEILKPEVSLVDVSFDTDTAEIIIVILVDDTEHMLTYDITPEEADQLMLASED